MELYIVEFEKDDYSEIIARDHRYDSRAYDFVLETISRACVSGKEHLSGREFLEWFRDLALDAYGPMAFTVLKDWGLNCCEDVGEVLFNLHDAGKIGKGESDCREDFIGGYDFKTTFFDPYAI